MRNCPPSPPLSTPSLNTPFWRADFYLYLAGDWQLTFCTGGKFLGAGPMAVGYSESIPRSGSPSILACICFCFPSIPLSHLSIHPSIYPSSNRATAPHAISFLSLLFQSPTLLRQNNWPGFNLLSFPATANWKTPLENPPHCQKRPLPSVSPSLYPSFQARRQARAHQIYWFTAPIGLLRQTAIISLQHFFDFEICVTWPRILCSESTASKHEDKDLQLYTGV